MLNISLSELASVVEGVIASGNSTGDRQMRGVSIDSRKIGKEDLFIAIPGERYDGHQFVGEALRRGAKAVIMARGKRHLINQEFFDRAALILVEDTKRALRDLAAWHRGQFDIPVVAVTGTNGKTTTKDMIADVLSSRLKVLKSPESYNNLIGVPLTLFQLSPRHQALVMELGMSSPGEIGILTRISDPGLGVITNIGPAHLESMSSVEKIAQAKFELPENMRSPKTLVLNADDHILTERIKEKRKDEKVISFGIQNKSDFFADAIELNGNGYIGFRINKEITLNLGVLGIHNVYNALAAFAVGRALELESEEIKGRLERYLPSKSRMELISIRGIRVINDSYNANPVSTSRALETLMEMKTSGRRYAVLADMLELGEKAEDYHKEMGRKAAQLGVDRLLVVGKLAQLIAEGAKEAGMSSRQVQRFENNQEVGSHLLHNLKDGDLVLVKGSRKMRTEEVVLTLKTLYGRQN
jgi:UDP-N-acetylmuramoyl-tripeptide--D-alanyl-D-alanine ligase